MRRDPFALVVWALGTAVMAYGFWLVARASQGVTAPVWWEIALVGGGIVASSIGAYAVGRAHASEGAWPDRGP